MKIKDIMTLDLGLFSEKRKELMGLAAIMIIVCHANIHQVAVPHLVQALFSQGNLGVDIFLFLSGMGLAYSLRNNKLTGGVIR